MFEPKSPPSHWLQLLERNPEALDWPERSTLPEQVARWIALHPEDASAQTLFALLAADGKWEVRRAVAESMGIVPEPLYSSVSKRLSGDVHFDVRQAALQTMQVRIPRHRRRTRTPKRRQMLHEIEVRHGLDAGRSAARLADASSNESLMAVAHDMNSMAARLRAAVFTLQGGYPKESDAANPGLHAIAGVAADMESTAASIAIFSRPIELTLVEADLGGAVDAAVQAAQSALRGQGRNIDPVTVKYHCPDAIRATISRSQFTMALIHLIKNAIESHGRGGHYEKGSVTVSVCREASHAVITIADDGTGIRCRDLLRLREFAPGLTPRNRVEVALACRSQTGSSMPTRAALLANHRRELERP